jgi:DNA-binding NtrC family response regulator
VIQALTVHRWPGNVRELRNTVEAALAMGEEPKPHDVEGAPEVGGADGAGFEALSLFPYGEAKAKLLEDFERAYLRALLDRTDGNVSQAAREARMDRTYLGRLLKKHGIRSQR